MHTTVIASAKGGVGKSTFCAEIGRLLAERNKKTLLVDMDMGVRSLDLLTGVAEKTVYHWGDVLLGNCTADKALLCLEKNLYLLPAPGTVQSVQEKAFGELLSSLKGFEEILLDAPAGMETGFCLARGVSQSCIILSTPDPVSIRAASFAAGDIRKSGIQDVRLVINRFRKKNGPRLCVDDVIDTVGARLLGIIPESEELGNLVNGKKPPYDCKGNLALVRIASRLCGEAIPLKMRNL